MTASGEKRRKYARPHEAVGNVTHLAQKRVDARVMEIMSRRDAASEQKSPAQRFSRRPDASGS